MENNRITESELVIPSLYLMSLDKNGTISTSDLIVRLTNLFRPTGQDGMILANRNDTYFSQKVRNLKSHNTLTKEGLVTYEDGIFQITDEGRKYVMKNIESINYLFSSDFDYLDIRKNFGKINSCKNTLVIPYNEIISEGSTTMRSYKTIERSKKLRDVAIEHFTRNGAIKCDCCGFEFNSFYGDKYGKSCIEIHHMKPIFQYEGISVIQTIEEALENLLPVCPNCHRVIHKCHITKDKLFDFKQAISFKNLNRQ